VLFSCLRGLFRLCLSSVTHCVSLWLALASQGWCSSPSEPQSNALCRQGQGSSWYVPPPFQPFHSNKVCPHWRSHSFLSHWAICDATGHRNPFAMILVPSISFTHSRVQGRNLASRLLIAKGETVMNCFIFYLLNLWMANREMR
jgi:hypothetical protein